MIESAGRRFYFVRIVRSCVLYWIHSIGGYMNPEHEETKARRKRERMTLTAQKYGLTLEQYIDPACALERKAMMARLHRANMSEENRAAERDKSRERMAKMRARRKQEV
jgi:predicted secreted Zn-dependent protease